jgi:hypothetical protein
VLLPKDRPFAPFQEWAIRAEGLKPSPLGILMHSAYGLWHAYRGALLFDRELVFSAPEKPIHHCDLCDGKPCLSACPVGAYSEHGFAYEACLSHVRSSAGKTCRDTGCLARNACPHGADYRYPPEVPTPDEAAPTAFFMVFGVWHLLLTIATRFGPRAETTP